MTRDEHGRPVLVRVPVLDPADLIGLTDGQRALLVSDAVAAADSAQDSLEPGTRRTYTQHIEAVTAWCAERGVPACPMSDAVFAAHIADVAYREDTDGNRVPGTLVHATLLVRVSAVDAWHKACGFSKPGDDPAVQAQVAAARGKGPPPGHYSDPLLAADLRVVLSAADRRDTERARAADDLLIVLAGNRQLSAARIARLDLTDLTATGDGLVVGAGRPVRLPATGGPGCPVTAYAIAAATRPDASGPAIEKPAGGRYTPQGLTKRARALAQEAGLPVPTTGLPRAAPAAVGLALTSVRRDHPSAVRDRSLEVAEFLRGLRPGSVGLVRWKMARPVPGHGPRGPVTVRVPRSKTDPHGDGLPVLLEHTGNRPTCPACLFWEWKDTATAVLGGDPWDILRDGPLWFPMLVNGAPAYAPDGSLPFLSAAAVSDVVARRAAAAGVPGRINGGSMRAGLVTSLGESGMRPQDIAPISDHTSLPNLARYDRSEPGRVGTAQRVGL